jgi:hypothetical protein
LHSEASDQKAEANVELTRASDLISETGARIYKRFIDGAKQSDAEARFALPQDVVSLETCSASQVKQ